MNMFSFFMRWFGKKHTIHTLTAVETHTRRVFTPSDWLIVGMFFISMVWGAGMLFATLSATFSEEIPVRGGIHKEGVVGSPRFVNPLLATSETDNDVTTLVFGGLMKSEPDGSLSPYIAASYEISDDKLEYTFVLREHATFSDGTPITANDVVFTVQTAKNPNIKSPRRANWEGVEVSALDEHTVVFTLKEPYGLFLENTTLGILPKHLWEHITPEEFPFSDLNTHPVGSGFYAVSSIKKNSSGVPSEYTLRAAKTTDERPYISTFIFKFYPNQEALQLAIQSGDIGGAHSVLPNETLKHSTLEEAVFARVFGIFFNQNQQGLFTDEVVRRALDTALDKNDIVNKVISGYGTALGGPLPPESVVKPPEANMDAEARIALAQGLLAKDGWTLGEDGVLGKTVKKEKKRLAFTLTTSNVSELKTVAELTAETWRKLGVEVTVQFFDQNDLNLEVIRPRKYDALLFGLVVGRELDLFAFWHSSQRNDPGLNIALYANITTDKYLEEARNEINPEKRREIATRAATEIEGETAAVFLYAPHFTYVHEPELKNVLLGTISKPSDRFAGIQDWYVNTERVWPFFVN